MSEVDLRGKRVFIRCDLNVPIEDGRISDDTRIRASVPGIKDALEQGAAVMVTSHLGRPTEGELDPRIRSRRSQIDWVLTSKNAKYRLVARLD